ncbi:hypothetical protein L218DRAFT_1010459 [Marasmius fiardii PR-910]|nr:hypothetical protein L218DRAFT_1010459 [Marasmius fiardii PR-910]
MSPNTLINSHTLSFLIIPLLTSAVSVGILPPPLLSPTHHHAPGTSHGDIAIVTAVPLPPMFSSFTLPASYSRVHSLLQW